MEGKVGKKPEKCWGEKSENSQNKSREKIRKKGRRKVGKKYGQDLGDEKSKYEAFGHRKYRTSNGPQMDALVVKSCVGF